MSKLLQFEFLGEILPKNDSEAQISISIKH